eukprot:5192650-Lingulodinium_polyedra.AAC.1
MRRHGRVASFLLQSLRTAAGRYSVAIQDFNQEVLLTRGCPFEALSEHDQDYTLADRVVEMWEAS